MKTYWLIIVLGFLITIFGCNKKDEIESGVYQIEENDARDTVIRQYEFSENGDFEKRLYIFMSGVGGGKKLTDKNSGTWKLIRNGSVEISIKKKFDIDQPTDSVTTTILEKPEVDTLKFRNDREKGIEFFFRANEYAPAKWEKWEKL